MEYPINSPTDNNNNTHNPISITEIVSLEMRSDKYTKTYVKTPIAVKEHALNIPIKKELFVLFISLVLCTPNTVKFPQEGQCSA